MWILECDGGILHGKSMWLRPGKKYLFGRTKAERGKYASFTMDHRSISRKHITISVSDVKPGAGSLVHVKSELSIEDEKTKHGTELDGEQIRGESRILKNDQHKFRLGSYEHHFRIKWHPVILTFTFPTKETKGGKDPLIPIRSRLEDLDIKMILPYVTAETTHVVAAKRNTAKGLQALINGKYIVDNSFLDALVYATTPGNLDEPESLSPLEEDFIGNWPAEKQHLPPAGKEPGQRSSELFAPNLGRKEIFQGYTFVFCDQKQFDNLQALIANGGGQALHFQVAMGETSTDEVVRYVKSVAGEKDVGEFNDGGRGKGVVLVKFPGEKTFEDWAINLQDEVALILGQRLIMQNEFLDAILMNDATKLRRGLPVVEEDTIVAPPPVALTGRSYVVPRTTKFGIDAAPPSAQAEISQVPPRRGRPRGTIVSAFKGFDDGFDRTQIATEGKAFGDRSEVVGVSQNGGSYAVSVEVDSQADDASATQTRSMRKRSLPSDDEDDEDISEKLLPAAAAMKRRKLEAEKDANERGVLLEPTSGMLKQKVKQPTEKSKPRKEVNIQEVVRERREAEEEAARKDDEALKEQLNASDVETMRNLAVVEEMEIPERKAKPRRRDDTGQDSERWNERWNGRKNFKKFRRSGQGDDRRRGLSVIVPLEEVKKKTHGIGEEYWLESDKSKKKRKEKEIASQSQSQPFTTARSRPEEDPSELVTGDEAEVIDMEAPRTTRVMDKTQNTEHESSESTSRVGKRPAPLVTNAGTAKRQKIFATPESDSDSEDDLKFRFKKRIRLNDQLSR